MEKTDAIAAGAAAHVEDLSRLFKHPVERREVIGTGLLVVERQPLGVPGVISRGPGEGERIKCPSVGGFSVSIVGCCIG